MLSPSAFSLKTTDILLHLTKQCSRMDEHILWRIIHLWAPETEIEAQFEWDNPVPTPTPTQTPTHYRWYAKRQEHGEVWTGEAFLLEPTVSS